MSRVSERRTSSLGQARMLLALLVILAIAVIGASSAGATHGGGYWFFQGNLPRPSGQYTATHESPCCGPWTIIRMSWEWWTHDMKFIWITWAGNWHGYWAQSDAHQYDYDITQISDRATYRAGGCQNPPEYHWWPVWTNCHVRSEIG
jgi:hypothetical protein